MAKDYVPEGQTPGERILFIGKVARDNLDLFADEAGR